METLRSDQLDLLARHRGQAPGPLLVASAAYRGGEELRKTAQGRELLAEPRGRLVSVAIAAAAAAVEWRRLAQEGADETGLVRLDAAGRFPLDVIDALKRRRLPFTAADVELVLDLGTSTMEHRRVFVRSFETLALGVAAAANLLRAEPGAPAVIGALERAGSALDALGMVETSGVGSLRRRIHALVAANAPGGLLDLSIVDPRDGWAEIAAAVLRRHASAWAQAQELVALLAAARGSRPAAAWRRRSTALASGYAGYGALLRELLEPLLEIGLTPSGAPWPPMWLLAPQNDALARGAAWALADVDEAWVVPLLGRLTLRCAAASPHPTVTTPLSHAVASGAIEALAAIGTAEALAELRVLLGELRRRDLLKRIAAIVGEDPDETLARDVSVRREKQRAVRRKANPEPKDRQRAASAHVRSELAPALRAAGFEDSAGRTFWRRLDDRVETLHCKAHKGGLTLEVGIWFRFVPRAHDVPTRNGRERPGEFHCDIRGKVHALDEDLAAAGRKAELWFARWRPLPVVLHWLLDDKHSEEAFGWGAPGSPLHAVLTGYVAREVGNDEVARDRLSRAADYFREALEDRRAERPGDVSEGQEAWVQRLEADAEAR